MPGPSSGDAVVVRFASRVVALLASRAETDAQGVRDDLLNLLEGASHDENPGRLADVLARFRKQRIPAEILADHYIPEVARRLGSGWLDDRLTFADVSLGAARLQAVLRDIGRHWAADTAPAYDAGSVLLIVPAGEQHTLGAMVAMGRLRRMGISVCLRFAPGRQELARLLQERRLDGVFISLSCSNGVDTCRDLVNTLRRLAAGSLPVVVGGAVTGLVPDLAARTGADAATDSLEQGLRACNLLTNAVSPRRQA